MNKQLFIKVNYSNEISVQAEVIKTNLLHKLKLAQTFKNMVEDEDYIVVKTKPKSTVIILNPDDNCRYNIISKSLDNSFEL